MTLHFKEYFDNLKKFVMEEKGLKEEELNYIFEGDFQKKKIKNEIKLGDLIIKFIEVVPLQIAKIKNYNFKAMSNGENIDINKITKGLSKNKKTKKLTIDKFANFIQFDMKDSILSFYDLPVVVLVFIGAQSIGKSTLANELIPSFFNVSGLRCTEGIWMSVSVFTGLNKDFKKCKNICHYCNTNICRLQEINDDHLCICDDCCCNKDCCLYIDADNEKIKKN
jgi:hypothetical protein